MRCEHDNRENNEVVEFSVARQYYEIHVGGNLYDALARLFATTRNDGDSRADLRRHRSHCARSAVAKGALFLTRPVLFHYIERRDALEASASELFEVVASGKGRIDVNQRFALKDAADAHKALEARATSGSTILTL